jgi:hypothetical protein
MMSTRFPSPPKHRLAFILAGFVLLLSGCAGFPGFGGMSCAQFEQASQETDYTTHYRLLEQDTKTLARRLPPLSRRTAAVVHVYEMRVDPYTTKSCNHLKLHKEVHIQRRAGKWRLEEVREFYTFGGALIASRTESVSNQLSRSGFYAGSTLLPIPEKAPPGRYRVISKLVLKSGSGTTVLARTSASFQVISRNNQ